MSLAIRSFSRRSVLGAAGAFALLPLVPSARAATPQASPVATTSLEDIIGRELENRSIPGAVVSVAQPGQEPWT
jgi:hypothetical protein